MTPFTIIDKLTGPYSFSRTNKDSLNAKSELYFHDIAFVPLFMQVSQLDLTGNPAMRDRQLKLAGALPQNYSRTSQQVQRAREAAQESGARQQGC